MAALYPEAPIFTILHDESVLRGTPLEGRDLRGSVLHKVPGARRRHRLLLPLMPYAVEQHDLRGYDVVISSHHAVAHGVLTRADQLHLAYTHSPARYAWDLYHEHVDPRRRAPIKRAALHRFRGWDQRAAQRVDHFFANSRHVARRIARAYRRSAEVVHPPVALGRFADASAPPERRARYVTLGRHVPYKRTHVAVEAFARSGRPLTVVGDGPDHGRLRGIAKRHPNADVRFVCDADEAAVVAELRAAKALVFAGEEDFGITLVEALAAGTPVVAWDRGGAREIVQPGVSGVLFESSTPEGIEHAIGGFETSGVSGSPDTLAAAAERFSADRFADTMRRRVAELWDRFAEYGPPTA